MNRAPPMRNRVAATLGWLLATVVSLAACGGDFRNAPEMQVVAEQVLLTSAPRVGTGADGTVWLAWTEDSPGAESVVAARVDPYGGVRRLEVSAPSAAFKRAPRLVMAGDTPVVAWREGGQAAGDQVRVAAWYGTQWVDEPGPGPYVAGEFDLMPAGDGRVVLTWSEVPPVGQPRRFVAIRSSAGAWSAASPLPAPGDPTSTLDTIDLAAADDGSMMAVWSEGPPQTSSTPTVRTLRAARFDPIAASWQPTATLDTGIGPDPHVAAAGSDWLAFWTEGDPTGPRTLHALRYTAGAWQGLPMRVDAALGESVREASAALRGGDSPWLVWVAATADVPSRFVVRASRLDAGVWSTPVVLAGPADSLASGLRVERDGDGRVAAVWGTSTGPAGPFLARTDGAGWRAATSLEEGGAFGNGPDLAPFVGGGFAIGWYRTPAQRHDVVLRRLP